MKAKVHRINEKDYEKIFIMTDIHGRYDLFEKISKKQKSFSKL